LYKEISNEFSGREFDWLLFKSFCCWLTAAEVKSKTANSSVRLLPNRYWEGKYRGVVDKRFWLSGFDVVRIFLDRMFNNVRLSFL
jgi:hypothetical protein